AASQSSGGSETCANSTVVSIPSRPTIASATDPTQCGIVEMEYGLERQWLGNDVHRDDVTGGLRFGIAPDLDLHWASSDFLSLDNAGQTQSGFGDTWLGVKYRFLKQKKTRPSLGVFYQAKVPSASQALGGSGQVDHSIAFLVSKDIHHLHLD